MACENLSATLMGAGWPQVHDASGADTGAYTPSFVAHLFGEGGPYDETTAFTACVYYPSGTPFVRALTVFDHMADETVAILISTHPEAPLWWDGVFGYNVGVFRSTPGNPALLDFDYAVDEDYNVVATGEVDWSAWLTPYDLVLFCSATVSTFFRDFIKCEEGA